MKLKKYNNEIQEESILKIVYKEFLQAMSFISKIEGTLCNG